jgi:hypothetical protein
MVHLTEFYKRPTKPLSVSAKAARPSELETPRTAALRILPRRNIRLLEEEESI